MKTLTTAEVAKLLNVSKTTIYRLVADGSIPVVKLKNGYRFLDDAISAWLWDLSLANMTPGAKRDMESKEPKNRPVATEFTPLEPLRTEITVFDEKTKQFVRRSLQVKRGDVS